jgi:hypothetical protein
VIRLRKGGDLRGIVKDPKGRRVADAKVYYGPPNRHMAPTVLTASDGVFTLASFPNKAQSISAAHFSYATSLLEIPAHTDVSNPLVITLEEGGTIQGHVSLPDSIEVGDCSVLIRYPKSYISLYHTALGHDASFSIPHLTSGDATVCLAMSIGENRWRNSRNLEQIVAIQDNETTDGNETLSTAAGTDGSYRIKNIPAGAGTLDIWLTRESTRETIEASLFIEFDEEMVLYQDIDMTELVR